MTPQSIKARTTRTYLECVGIDPRETGLQFLMRAHLGPGPIPLTHDEELLAMPFLDRLCGLLRRSAEHGLTYDYGIIAAREIDQRAPIGTAPRLGALLAVLGGHNQTIEPYVAELDRIRDALAVAVHHVTTSRTQTAASATMLAGLLERRVQPDRRVATKLLGG